jgi:hypothetical protein
MFHNHIAQLAILSEELILLIAFLFQKVLEMSVQTFKYHDKIILKILAIIKSH